MGKDGNQPAGKSEAEGLDALRSLLLGQEKEAIEEIKTRIDDPSVQAKDLVKVLPHAIRVSAEQGDDLSRSLRPTVRDALFETARKEPGRLVDALYPVLGPALRRSINAALQGLVTTLDEMLEKSFSLRSWQWRWESYRTGKPFAEVLLSKTLVYRVEQVFLIHAETGLLLEHVFGRGIVKRDEDMVSGMLNAVQQFLRDSFEGDDGGELRTMQLGDLTVWIERGPDATLAAVIRGSAPPGYQVAMQEALEKIHLENAVEFREFDGRDGRDGAFASARLILEDCLWEQRRREAKGGKKRPWFAYVVLVFLLVGVVLLTVRLLDDGAKWEKFFAAVEAEPGLMLVAKERVSGGYLISGLRDPLAVDPERLLADHGLEGARLETRWEPFVSAADSLRLARARERLRLPEERSTVLTGKVLTLEGDADAGWLAEMRGRVAELPGIERIEITGEELRPASRPEPAKIVPDATNTVAVSMGPVLPELPVDATQVATNPPAGDPVAHVEPADPPDSAVPAIALDELAAEVDGLLVQFTNGTEATAGSAETLRGVADAVRRAVALADEAGHRLVIRLAGHSDFSGSAVANQRVSLKRAEWVRDRLAEQGIDRDLFRVSGAGFGEPLPDVEPADLRNRRVSFALEHRPESR